LAHVLFTEEMRREVVHVLNVLEQIAPRIPTDSANVLSGECFSSHPIIVVTNGGSGADDLLSHLSTFSSPPNVIQAMIQALVQICKYATFSSWPYITMSISLK